MWVMMPIDIVRLVSLIREKKYEIIHTHLFNDHFIAGIAARCISKRITVVRTVYDGTGLDNIMRNRALMSYFTDGLIAVSESSRKKIEEDFKFPPGQIWKISPGVDCTRFNKKIDGSKVKRTVWNWLE